MQDPENQPYLLEGDNFRLKVIRKLGEGGFGKVYECRLAGCSEPLVVKYALRRDQATAESILSEIEVIGSLPEHPNIVRTMNKRIISENKIYMLMEKCECSLDELFDIDELLVVKLFAQMVEALHFLALNKRVHLDIKSENVLYKRGTFKLADFNLSLNLNKYKEGSSMGGSIRYLAPERVAGATPNIGCDIFSLGLLLFQKLEGDHPYCKGSEQSLEAYLSSVRSVRPVFSKRQLKVKLDMKEYEQFQGIVQRMVKADPQQRIGLEELLHYSANSPLVERALLYCPHEKPFESILLADNFVVSHVSSVSIELVPVQLFSSDQYSFYLSKAYNAQLELKLLCKLSCQLQLDMDKEQEEVLLTKWIIHLLMLLKQDKLTALKTTLLKAKPYLSAQTFSNYSRLAKEQGEKVGLQVLRSGEGIRSLGQKVPSGSVADLAKDLTLRLRCLIELKLLKLSEHESPEMNKLVRKVCRMGLILEFVRAENYEEDLDLRLCEIEAAGFKELLLRLKLLSQRFQICYVAELDLETDFDTVEIIN